MKDIKHVPDDHIFDPVYAASRPWRRIRTIIMTRLLRWLRK